MIDSCRNRLWSWIEPENSGRNKPALSAQLDVEVPLMRQKELHWPPKSAQV